MEREVLSYCRICAAACGIVVTVDGERVVRVRGDAGHPVSRGYTCAKGRGLPAWHHHPGAPRPAAAAGRRRRVGRAARRPRPGRSATIVAGDGPDAVALYLATGMAYDAAGQIAAATWLGVDRAAARSTPRSPSTTRPVLVAAELVTGNADAEPGVGPDRARAARCWSAPTRSCPTATARRCPIRSATSATIRARGGRVWVLDPRRTETRRARRRAPPGPARAPTSLCSPRWRRRAAGRRRRRRRAPRLLHAGRRRRAARGARAVHGRRAAAAAAGVEPGVVERLVAERPSRTPAGSR